MVKVTSIVLLVKQLKCIFVAVGIYMNIYCKGNVAFADKNKKGLVTRPSKSNAFQYMYMHKKETTCSVVKYRCMHKHWYK